MYIITYIWRQISPQCLKYVRSLFLMEIGTKCLVHVTQCRQVFMIHTDASELLIATTPNKSQAHLYKIIKFLMYACCIHTISSELYLDFIYYKHTISSRHHLSIRRITMWWTYQKHIHAVCTNTISYTEVCIKIVHSNLLTRLLGLNFLFSSLYHVQVPPSFIFQMFQAFSSFLQVSINVLFQSTSGG